MPKSFQGWWCILPFCSAILLSPKGSADMPGKCLICHITHRVCECSWCCHRLSLMSCPPDFANSLCLISPDTSCTEWKWSWLFCWLICFCLISLKTAPQFIVFNSIAVTVLLRLIFYSDFKSILQPHCR